MVWIMQWVLRETSLHTAGFIYAITGTTTALTFITWVFTKDWPLNIGGKPYFALPAWIPITFELTVLFAAVGMVLTFCYLCQLAPFVKKHHFHPRATDDLFVMALNVLIKQMMQKRSAFLQNAGAKEVAMYSMKKQDGGLVVMIKNSKRLKKEEQMQLINQLHRMMMKKFLIIAGCYDSSDR